MTYYGYNIFSNMITTTCENFNFISAKKHDEIGAFIREHEYLTLTLVSGRRIVRCQKKIFWLDSFLSSTIL